MASKNATIVGQKKVTHEGAQAYFINSKQQLERTISACLLWENSFYESGESVADRINSLVKVTDPNFVLDMALKARNDMKLRHVGLFLVASLEKQFKTHAAKNRVDDVLAEIIQRPDELTEFLALYWEGKQPNAKKTLMLTAAVKRGLARAFGKFNEYQLAKYNNTEKAYKLKDVFRLLCDNSIPKFYPRAKFAELRGLWDKLMKDQLAVPDTWETQLSAGADKKETFTRLIEEKKLGAMALLRNLRNMIESGVDEKMVRNAILTANAEKVLPFRFITAAKYGQKFEPELEQLMFKCLAGNDKLAGKTALLIDKSGSMYGPKISAKSELDRFEAASALAMLLREVCESSVVIAFGSTPHTVPSRRGFGLRDAIVQSHAGGGTNTEDAKKLADKEGYDRIIIVTDEQSHQALSTPKGKGYVVNVASYQNGVGYGPWNHIDGWSEAIVNYILAFEKLSLN
jgi:60 kDa SS-A/Ro ribonucleoprotein